MPFAAPTPRRFRAGLVAGGLALALGAPAPAAHASFLTFFGEDLNNSPTVPLGSFPSASAAEADFLSNLVGVGTEDFESFANGTGEPLNLTFPGAGGATLSGGGGEIVSVTPGSTNGFGRYATSGSNYWEVAAGGTNNFVVDFDDPVAAFGFFGVDIGDFGGQLELELTNGVMETLTVSNTEGSFGSTDGSVLFFGVIATNSSHQFDSVSFLTTAGQGDVFAFDDFTVGAREQVQVPEPATLALVGIGLAGVGVAARRRRTA